MLPPMTLRLMIIVSPALAVMTVRLARPPRKDTMRWLSYAYQRAHEVLQVEGLLGLLLAQPAPELPSGD